LAQFKIFKLFKLFFFRDNLSHEYEKIAATKICSDEDEAKYIAKRRMLGNIRFIGELGKLQIIQEAVLFK
jgi:translation initiation factor 4G